MTLQKKNSSVLTELCLDDIKDSMEILDAYVIDTKTVVASWEDFQNRRSLSQNNQAKDLVCT